MFYQHADISKLKGTHKITTTVKAVSIALGASLISWSQGVLAEENKNVIVEEIVTTAQKRSQNIQDVPLVINSYSELSLRNSGVNTVADLQLTVPGFVFQRNVSQSSPFLRGVGSEVSSPGTESSIATHVDGVYIARPSATLSDIFDVDRVEVIKGPQGTLYGRNATGGVVNIINKRPELGEFSGTVRGTLGNENTRKIEAAINIPFGESSAYRLSVNYHKNDGFGRNVVLDEAVDFTDTLNFRHQYLIDFSDEVSLRFFASHYDSERGTGTTFENITYPDSWFSDPSLLIRDDDPRTIINDVPETVEFKGHSYGAELNWDFDKVSLKSLTAFSNSEYLFISDFDGTNFNLFGVFGQDETSDAFTQEFQFTSNNDGPLQWTAGLYFFEEDAETNFYAIDAGADFGNIGPGTTVDLDSAFTFLQRGLVDTSAQAIFGQFDYEVDEQLSFTLGLRYSQENKKLSTQGFSVAPFSVNGGAPILTIPQASATFANRGAATGTPLSFDQDYSSVTPRFVVNYRTSDDVLLWASATEGFKSGGANIRGGNPAEVEEESLWSYEGGIKSTLLDGSLTLNVTGYYYDFENIQLNVTSPENIANNNFTRDLLNVGDVRTIGIEVDAIYYPTEHLKLYANFARQNAEFVTDFTAADATQGNVVSNINGNPLPRAPDLNYTVGADYQWNLDNGGNLKLHGDYTYRDEIFFDIFGNAPLREDSFGTANTRLSYTAPDQKWDVALFVKNIADTTYRVNRTFFFGEFTVVGEPRTFGINAGYNF